MLEQLKFITESIDSLNVSWALIGGLTVSIYCEPRFTKDFDIAIALDGVDVQDKPVDLLFSS